MVVLDKGSLFFFFSFSFGCDKRRNVHEKEREEWRMYLQCNCYAPFSGGFLILGLIRETLIKTALELAYYVQADSV